MTHVDSHAHCRARFVECANEGPMQGRFSRCELFTATPLSRPFGSPWSARCDRGLREPTEPPHSSSPIRVPRMIPHAVDSVSLRDAQAIAERLAPIVYL